MAPDNDFQIFSFSIFAKYWVDTKGERGEEGEKDRDSERVEGERGEERKKERERGGIM